MSSTPRRADSIIHLLIACLLLASMFGLAAGAMLREAPTFDEGFYVARGWAFLRTGHLLPLGHPPLTNVLSGLGVLLEPGLPDPTALDGWAADDYETFSKDLLWHQGVNASRVVFLARLPILWLGLLLGALIYRWGREAYGPWSAALALLLFAFAPDVLAHAGLATTDLGVAAFYIAALYAWTRFLRIRQGRWLVIAGVLFGLAQASKYSALALIPTLAIMTIWSAVRRGKIVPRGAGWVERVFARLGGLPLGWLWTALGALITMGAVGLAALWAAYLFRFRAYPLDLYVAEFRHFLELAAAGHEAYLLGRFSESGWWYYHPLALAVKTTLPVQLLLVLAITLAVGREMRRCEWDFVFPALLHLGFTMLGTLNVGVRYLLPMIPLMFLFVARIAYGPLQTGWLRPGILGLLAALHIGASLRAYPHYIAFFNAAAGGPDRGYRLLVDSNLDWGQDLPGLAAYLRGRGVQGPIFLSYFGQADPAYYGIDYIPLPGWPPPPPDPDRPDFHPLNPAPGLYAISASNLVGVQAYDPDSFGYFRAREPVARIGHSIFVYEVGANVPPPRPEQDRPWLAQCAAPDPSESEPALEGLTGLDDLRVLYFDCRQALPFPNGPGWILAQEGFDPVIDLGAPDYLARWDDGSPRYRVWLVGSAPDAPSSTVDFPAVSLPLPIAGHVELLGYRLDSGEVRPGETVILTAWWRVREPPPPPVSIYAHLLRPDGSLLAAGDALGVPAEEWASGMIVVQQHRFPIPEDTPGGSYTLRVGLYALNTGQRYLVSQSGDRVIDGIGLRTVEVLDGGP